MSVIRPASARARGRLTGSSSYDRILAAAKKLFASRGYENTSTIAIARQAGTSESQLMKHFGNKEGILEAIFDQAWSRINPQIRPVLGAGEPPAKKLNVLAGLLTAAFDKDPDLKVLMLLEGRRIRKEGHMVMMTAGYLEFVGMLDAVLDEMRASGQLRSGAHPQAIRSALMGMWEGLMRDLLLAKRARYPARYGPKDAGMVVNAVLAFFTGAPDQPSS